MPTGWEDVYLQELKSKQTDIGNMIQSLNGLEGKAVEIVYQNLVYKGCLVGVSEEEVYLQTLSRRVVLPMSDITAIRALPEKATE